MERGDVCGQSGDGGASLSVLVVPQEGWMGLEISARSHYCFEDESWAAGRSPWFGFVMVGRTEREIPRLEKGKGKLEHETSTTSLSHGNASTISARGSISFPKRCTIYGTSMLSSIMVDFHARIIAAEHSPNGTDEPLDLM